MGDAPEAPLFPPVVAPDPRAEQRKRDLQSAQKLDDIAKYYLDAGLDPRYVAQRYGLPLERCERYAAKLKEREQAKKGAG